VRRDALTRGHATSSELAQIAGSWLARWNAMRANGGQPECRLHGWEQPWPEWIDRARWGNAIVSAGHARPARPRRRAGTRAVVFLLSDPETLLDTLLRDRPELISSAHGAMVLAWVAVKPRFDEVCHELGRTITDRRRHRWSCQPRSARNSCAWLDRRAAPTQVAPVRGGRRADRRACRADEAERFWQQWLARYADQELPGG
jgi:hypothetical protein